MLYVKVRPDTKFLLFGLMCYAKTKGGSIDWMTLAPSRVICPPEDSGLNRINPHEQQKLSSEGLHFKYLLLWNIYNFNNY